MKKRLLLLALALLASVAVLPSMAEGEMMGNMYLTGLPIAFPHWLADDLRTLKGVTRGFYIDGSSNPPFDQFRVRYSVCAAVGRAAGSHGPPPPLCPSEPLLPYKSTIFAGCPAGSGIL